jgi:hypothetical protein
MEAVGSKGEVERRPVGDLTVPENAVEVEDDSAEDTRAH